MSHHATLFTALAGIVSLLVAAPAQGDDEITVRLLKRIGDPLCPGPNHVDLFYQPGEDIALSVAYCTEQINSWAVDAVSDIGRVTLNGSGGPDLKVFIGSGTFPTGGGAMTPACGDFDGLVITNSTLRDNTSFAGRVRDNLTGSVHVGEMYRFDVDGEIQGSIRATSAGLFRVNAGTSTSAGTITCDTGAIDRVDIDGTVNGSITAALLTSAQRMKHHTSRN